MGTRAIDTAAAIRLEEVHYTIEKKHIIRNVSGEISTGHVTALIGPSGAGKTTLLRLFNGLISPTQGEIYVKGQEIRQQSPIEVRRRVGIVLQNSPMMKGTVQDNLALPLKLRGRELSEERAVSTMERVGLNPSLLTQDARELSGGQQQKVSIARTLLNESEILLLDEITSSLDPASLQEIEELIMELNETEKITIVWITHNLQQASRVGGYFWVVADGELRQAGPKEEINTTQDDEIKRFLGGTVL